MDTDTAIQKDEQQAQDQQNVDPMSIESDFKPLTKEELHARAKDRNWSVKNSVNRSQFSAYGVRGWGGEHITMADSYHESEALAFSAKYKSCASCKIDIPPFVLYSTGQRYLDPDAPVPVQGRDDVHLKCTGEYRGKTLREVVQGQDVSKFVGWAELPLEVKQKFLHFSGQKVSQELLDKKQAFTGMVAILCGEFSESKDTLGILIQQNGGQVLQAPSRNINYMVLGATGTTAYGQKTGRGSKKYKDAMKFKPTVVDEKWLRDSIARWEKLGVCALQPKEEAPKKQAAAKGAKRKAEEQAEPEEKKETDNNKVEEKVTEKQETKKAKAEPKETEKQDKSDLGFTEASLKDMKRAELQALCKKNNLRAVGKNEEMIARLQALLK